MAGRPEIKIEPSPKWVRVMYGGRFIAESRKVLLLYSAGPPFPLYYFPKADVRMEYLQHSNHVREVGAGEAHFWTVRAGDRVVDDAAWNIPAVSVNGLDLGDYFSFDWEKMDAWFEEAEEVFVHPHDPHHRIDTLYGSSHVVVALDGEKVAESHSPVILFETGLPTRYYLPKVDLRMDLLVPSNTITKCAYKGTASYYSANVAGQTFPDIAWFYKFTTTETSKIAARISFYNERVDLFVDGVQMERPRTHWS